MSNCEVQLKPRSELHVLFRLQSGHSLAYFNASWHLLCGTNFHIMDLKQSNKVNLLSSTHGHYVIKFWCPSMGHFVSFLSRILKWIKFHKIFWNKFYNYTKMQNYHTWTCCGADKAKTTASAISTASRHYKSIFRNNMTFIYICLIAA